LALGQGCIGEHMRGDMTRDSSRTARIVALLRQACVGHGAGGGPDSRHPEGSWLMNGGILSAISRARGKRSHDVRMESMQSSTVGGAGIRETSGQPAGGL